MQNKIETLSRTFVMSSAIILGGCASTGRMVGTDIPTMDNIGKVPALCSARSAAEIKLPFLISLQFPTGAEMDKACIEGFNIAAPFSRQNKDGSYNPWQIITFNNRYTKLIGEVSALTPDEPRALQINEILNYTSLFLGHLTGGRLTPDIILKLYERGETNAKPQPSEHKLCTENNDQYICK